MDQLSHNGTWPPAITGNVFLQNMIFGRAYWECSVVKLCIHHCVWVVHDCMDSETSQWQTLLDDILITLYVDLWPPAYHTMLPCGTCCDI